MAKESAKSTDQIGKLLEERQTIEQWLERLSLAADKAPSHVKERVESDYRKRLEEVVTELQSHREGISEELERKRTKREGLSDQEKDGEERLAEGELRHSVGEFDDNRWSEMKDEILDSLVKVRDELESVGEEVSKLEEVMADIERQPEPSDAEELEALIAIPEIPEVDDELEDDLKAPSGAATSTAEEEPAVAEAEPRPSFDELEFIRSVTEDAKAGPSSTRASGEIAVPPEVVEEQPVAQSQSSIGAEGVTSFADDSAQPKKAAAKTLKCTECGTMNLPTEWYCERCGAELAAL
jgi:hypothetical protein